MYTSDYAEFLPNADANFLKSIKKIREKKIKVAALLTQVESLETEIQDGEYNLRVKIKEQWTTAEIISAQNLCKTNLNSI